MSPVISPLGNDSDVSSAGHAVPYIYSRAGIRFGGKKRWGWVAPFWRLGHQDWSLSSLSPAAGQEGIPCARKVNRKREEPPLTEWGRPLQRKRLRTEPGGRLKSEIILLTPPLKPREQQGNTWKLWLQHPGAMSPKLSSRMGDPTPSLQGPKPPERWRGCLPPGPPHGLGMFGFSAHGLKWSDETPALGGLSWKQRGKY